MKSYTPFLLHQLARFGALSVPQMLRICTGKCSRSSLYRALTELEKGHFVYPILNPASRTRAYYATKEGREYVLGDATPLTSGIKARELDHTLLCAEILLNLCQFENVTGISTHFEISLDAVDRFSHARIPDGIFRLTQNGHHYELALEVESSVRNIERMTAVLDQYWEAFKLGLECSGLLIVAMDTTIFGMYESLLKNMPEPFQARVKLLQGSDLSGLRPEAYGQRTASITRCLDLVRTSSQGLISYHEAKPA